MPHSALFFLAIFAGSYSCHAAIVDDPSPAAENSDSRKPGPNLIKNASFEAVKDEMPAGWKKANLCHREPFWPNREEVHQDFFNRWSKRKLEFYHCGQAKNGLSPVSLGED